MKCKWPLYGNKCLFWSWQCSKSVIYDYRCLSVDLPKSKRAQLLSWWVPQAVWPVPSCSCHTCAVSFCWWMFSLLSLLWVAPSTHEALALPHVGSGPGVTGRATADAPASPAAERWALLQRGSQSSGLWTQLVIALKHLNSLEELTLMNWLRFRLLKLMTKRIFLMSFLRILLLWNARVHFTQHFSWG